MTTVAEIKRAIDQLSLEERAELMAQIRGETEDDDWDRQMRADAAAGKFDAINAQAEADYRAGRCRDLPEGLEE